MIRRFAHGEVTRRALHLTLSPAERRELLDFLKQPGRVTVPDPENPLVLAGNIMAHLDRSETVLQGALDGCDGDTAYKMWGFFHEFGHNWQKRVYTPSYMREITVNIFTMYANMQAYGISPAVHEMPRRAGLPYLREYLDRPEAILRDFTSLSI